MGVMTPFEMQYPELLSPNILNQGISTGGISVMEFDHVKINGIEVPITRDEGGVYYPINYIMAKILNKQIGFSKIDKQQNINNIKVVKIYFGEKNIQETQCFEYESFKKYLEKKKFNLGTFDEQSIKGYEQLLKYFN
jgi:hypothetical protein